MPTAPLVSANGASIPAIGLGTYLLTGESCTEAVVSALGAGYRHIDTAAMYGNEAEVGAGLKAGGIPRDEIFVTTKVWRDDIAEGDLQRAAAASLRKLGLDRVDLLLIHWPNEAVPVGQSIRALGAAKRAGLARHVGVSNFPTALLAEALAAADEPLAANQCEYHPMLNQNAVLAACRAAGMAFISYSPLGRAAALSDPTIRTIAEAHGKTVSQVLLRWHIQQPGVVAIPKSATPEHIRQNLEVGDFMLSPDEMARIFALARPDGRVINPPFAPRWDEAA